MRDSMRRPAAPSRTDADLGLLDFVPRTTPRWARPEHLAPIAELVERAMREEVRALVSVPPQHGKTELLLHAIAWVLRKHPDRTCAYASYAADIATSKSRLARDYALAAGVELRKDGKALHEWRTAQGGGLLATGIGGPLTGHGINGILFVDDPHKNRAEAESKTIRDGVQGWYTSTALTRVHPGASVIVVHTRWHEDDLIGRLRKETEEPYEVISLPAISADGKALWEDRRPLSWLHRQKTRVGPYDWASLYMGEPRPRGGAVFNDVRFYDKLPDGPRRYAIGVDLAYTKKTQADHSVAVVLAEIGGLYYVLEVIREQVKAPEFAAKLRALLARFPGVMPRWYCAGIEKAVADLLASLEQPVHVNAIATQADKFTRAQLTAAAWNAGKILLPQDARWVSDFVGEVAAFTGVNDRHDDQVDALAAAFDALDQFGTPSLSAFDAYQGLLPQTRF